MNRKFKKILSYLPPVFLDYYEMIFEGAAENHLRFNELKMRKFRSYTELKRRQKIIRAYVSIFVLAAVSILLGILVGPIIFPQPIEPEVYIPNGKGDILLGNISRNQATVIFKTLDSANGNKPLATKAAVEFYEDSEYTKLVRRSNETDYAVTHIVPVDSLQEGVVYYIRIIAKDAAKPEHTKVITSWGNGNDPIRLYTTGELVPTCAVAKIDEAEKIETKTVPLAQAFEVSKTDDESENKDSLQIDDVQNENYLQPKNKVQTIISWSTNFPSTSALVYSEEKSANKIEISTSDQLQTRHQIVLTTLKPGTTYYFQTKSLDKDTNVAISEEYSLRTPRAQETVVKKIGDNFKDLMNQIKPR